MRVAVTGGTGFIGGHLAACLARRGHDLVLIARGVDRSDHGLRLVAGSALVHASVIDGSRLRDAFAGCDAVFHLAGITAPRGAQTFEAVHVAGTAAAVEAARAVGVPRFAMVSSRFAAPDAPHPLFETKWRAEEIVRDAGIEHTILRSAAVYGRGDHVVNAVARAVTTRTVYPLDLRRRLLRPLAVADLVTVLAASLDDSRLVRSTVTVEGPDEVAVADLVRVVAMALRRKPVCVRVPRWLHPFDRGAIPVMVDGSAPPTALPTATATLPADLAPRIRFTVGAIVDSLPSPAARPAAVV